MQPYREFAFLKIFSSISRARAASARIHQPSVCFCEPGPIVRRFAADQASSAAVALPKRYRSAGRARLFADAGFAPRSTAPVDDGESAAAFAFHLRAELLVVLQLTRVGTHRVARLRIKAPLHIVEQRSHVRRDAVKRCAGLRLFAR